MRYTISEMASLLGVTTHTLRYYEKISESSGNGGANCRPSIHCGGTA